MKRYLPFLTLIFLIGGCLWAQSGEEARREALRQLIGKADEGNAKALFDLARLYETGYDTIPQDSVRSMNLYMKSARLGYPPAMNIIGFRYQTGEGLKEDIDSSFYWITKAAEAGDVTAASNLGYLYSINKDYQKAEFWLQKAVQAGIPSAMSQLGDFRRMGLTGLPDTLAARNLYDSAIEGGDWDAQFKLLAMMGYKWQNLPGPEALKMGLKYYLGNAPVAGVELFEIASRDSVPQALALLGDAYSRGIGVEYNPRKSLDYFHESALSGNPAAQFLIAELLDFYPDEFEESAEYWRQAALDSGVTDAEEAYSQLFTIPE